MQREKLDRDDENKDKGSNEIFSAFGKIEERMQKRRRRAPLWKLISYIIVLILVLLLMFWLRRGYLNR